MNLDEAMERVVKKANPDREPKALHWLESDGGDDCEYDYCWKCAGALADYFNEVGARPEVVWEGEELPDFQPGEQEVWIGGGWGLESDSGRHCCRCGAQLEVSLTTNGTRYEIEHYEQYGVGTNWWTFYQMLYGASETDDEDLRVRALALAEKYLGADCDDGLPG